MKRKSRRSRKQARHFADEEAAETRLLVEYAFDMASRLGIRNVFVRADQVVDRRLVEECRSDEKLFWLVHSKDIPKRSESVSDEILIGIPDNAVGGSDEMTVGLTAAVLLQELKVEETAICLTGVAGSNRLDNLLVINPERDLSWFRDHKMSRATKKIASEEGIRLLDIALRFASEGREGKPIGTIFVLGNPRVTNKFVRPLILNPLSGHPSGTRSIHNPDFFETMRELSAIDGAFVINTRGVVLQAGVYLNAKANAKTIVKEGMGSRHVAAAAISANTNGVTFVISESSGRVTVFADGAAILELDGR